MPSLQFYISKYYDFLNFLKIFEIIVDSRVARNNTERCHVPFIHFLPMDTSGKTIVQYHSQNIDIDTVMTWHFHHHKDPFCCLFRATSNSLPPLLSPGPQATTNLFSIPTILPFQKSSNNGIVCKLFGFIFFTQNNSVEIHPGWVY